MKTTFNVSKNYWGLNIEKIEKDKEAKYIGDFCLKDMKGNWTEIPVSIFYVESPDVEQGHSHYFGLYFRFIGPDFEPLQTAYITKGDSAFEEPLTGIIADDGEVVISCYRHDYRESTDKSVMIDGGRDYNRYRGHSDRLVKVGVEKDKLHII